MDHRVAPLGDGRLVTTSLPAASHLVRFHPTADLSYDRMIVVTEMDNGANLFLSGWVAPEGQAPLTHNQWRAAKAALFPTAREVMFERHRSDGTVRTVRMPV